MRIDGSALNPFRGLDLYGTTQESSQVPGVPGFSEEESGPQFVANVETAPEGPLPYPPFTQSAVAMTDLAQRMDQLEDVQDLEGPDMAFAMEMHRRLTGTTNEDGELQDPTALVKSLSDAVGYLKDKHGPEAATAAMAMILGSTGTNTSEESLSNGLLNVLEMVDRNFGIAAGDDAMAMFNGALNNALNDHFDNGLTERFLVVGEGAENVSIAMTDVHDRFARQVAEATEGGPDEKSLTELLLEELTEQLEDATTPEALAEAEAKAAQTIDEMRDGGMGWGEIARELGLEPSSVGLGRIKQAGHEGEPVEFGHPTEAKAASLAESLVESTADRLTARAREAYGFAPAPEPEFLSATV